MNKGHYLIGVECDGATYQSSSSARDRDRLREQVLRKLGWRIHRIWAPAWVARRDSEIRRLQEAIEQAQGPVILRIRVELAGEVTHRQEDHADQQACAKPDGSAIPCPDHARARRNAGRGENPRASRAPRWRELDADGGMPDAFPLILFCKQRSR